MIEQKIMEFASASPDFAVGIEEITKRLSNTPIVAEDLLEAIQMLEMALQDPAKYPEIVRAAIADGLIDPGDAPEQYDAVFIISMLIALYGLRDRLSAEGFARGGLTVAGRKLADMGQGGDSMLAHINPREAEILRRMGGQGTVNPNTGIVEYKSLKKIIKTVAPVALSIFAPGLGTAIGGALGLSGTAAAVVGGGLLGAGTAALTGGDPLKGALLGGIGGGFGDVAGGFVNETLGLGLSPTAAGYVGSGLVGGVAGELTGGDFASGALQGVAGQALKSFAPDGTPKNAFEAGLQSGTQTAGNMLTAGYSPKESLQGGLSSGIIAGAKEYVKPSNAVIKEVSSEKSNNPVTNTQYEDFTANESYAVDNGKLIRLDVDSALEFNNTGVYDGILYVDGVSQGPYLGQTPMDQGTMVNQDTVIDNTGEEPGLFKKAVNYATENPVEAGLLGLTALSAMEAPPDIQAAVTELSPEQQEYFNRPLVSWDWDRLRLDANNANMSIGAFISQNMPTISQGYYNTVTTPAGAYSGGPINMNMGGLNQMSRYVRGTGTGRSDEIPAYLSDGEYVIDAETVAMLGDGSNKAGADVLDDMRKNLRRHKGKNLSKGKFSADAKSPLQYMRGVA